MRKAFRSSNCVQTIVVAKTIFSAALILFVPASNGSAQNVRSLKAKPRSATGLSKNQSSTPDPSTAPVTFPEVQGSQSFSIPEQSGDRAGADQAIVDVLTRMEHDVKKPAVLDYLQVAAGFSSLIAFLVLIYQTYLLRLQTAVLGNSIRASTYQQIASAYIDINKELAKDSDLAAAFDSFDALFPDDFVVDVTLERRRRWLGFWLLNHYENAHSQFTIGGLSVQQWNAIAQDCIFHICNRPYLRHQFEESRLVFSEAFVSFVDAHMPHQDRK
jgi:hypothetical protein